MLIKQGARLAESAADILEELVPLARRMVPEKSKTAPVEEERGLGAMEKRILKALENSFNGMPADILGASLGAGPAELSASLTALEIKGLVKCLPGNTYVRTRAENN
jgi:DNA processing protein